MEEEEDQESAKNHSSNPLMDTDMILLELLDIENEIWINTKTNMCYVQVRMGLNFRK